MDDSSVTRIAPARQGLVDLDIGEAVTDYGDLLRIADGLSRSPPSWPIREIAFKTRSPKGRGRSPQHHYRCETFERLKALPVPAIAAEHAFLFLWIPPRSVFLTGRSWFVVPGGPVTDAVATKIMEHPSVVGGKDRLFPAHDKTWRMLEFVS